MVNGANSEQLRRRSLHLFTSHRTSVAGSSSSTAAAPSAAAGAGAVSVLWPTKQKTKSDAVVAATWSADGSVLVSGDKAGVVSFWSLAGL